MKQLNLVLNASPRFGGRDQPGRRRVRVAPQPGSGKHFRGRSVLVDLAVANGEAAFDYLEEGGWRDTKGDTKSALEAAARTTSAPRPPCRTTASVWCLSRPIAR